MLYKPASRKVAKCYKETKLRHRWPDDCQGFKGGFYEAKVVAVPQLPVQEDERGVYLTLECKLFILSIPGLRSIRDSCTPQALSWTISSLGKDHNIVTGQGS